MELHLGHALGGDDKHLAASKPSMEMKYTSILSHFDF